MQGCPAITRDTRFLLGVPLPFRCACANRNNSMVRHERGDCKTANGLSLIPADFARADIEEWEEQETE
jgi:hypothetical protein